MRRPVARLLDELVIELESHVGWDRKRVDERLHRDAFQLERAGVDDEPGADRHDVFDDDEVVRLQRVAGRHEVDDRIGETRERRQLHRAVEFDQIDVHRLRREMLARDAHVFGRDTDPRATLHHRRPVVTAPRRDDEAAAADAEIEGLVEAVAAVLEQHVLAGDAHVRRAVLHVGRNVGRAEHDERYLRAIRPEDQFSRRRRIFIRDQARDSKKRQRLVENATLGQGDGQRGHGRSGADAWSCSFYRTAPSSLPFSREREPHSRPSPRCEGGGGEATAAPCERLVAVAKRCRYEKD